MNVVRIASCAATLFALAATLGANAQDTTCGKNHYILGYAVSPWTATGSLNVPRSGHTATLLPDGRVLVAGGRSTSNTGVDTLDSAEIYDAVTGLWTVTGTLGKPRVGHAAMLLPSGKLLVAGGEVVTWVMGGTFRRELVGTAELYDPDTGTWTPTGNLNIPRSSFAAMVLTTGQVLIAGGFEKGFGPTHYAELYDPSTETWSFTGNLVTYRSDHTATPLEDGRILVTGGYDGDLFQTGTFEAELYDPIAGTWSSAAALTLGRASHTATSLQDGKVLIAGGYREAPDRIPGSPGFGYKTTSLDQAEIFDPVTGTWQIVGNLNEARDSHTATLLPDGKVLVVGGYDNNARLSVSGTELYDPAAATWLVVASLGSARYGHTATLLPDGTVLVAGGRSYGPSGDVTLGSAELYAAPSSDDCE